MFVVGHNHIDYNTVDSIADNIVNCIDLDRYMTMDMMKKKFQQNVQEVIEIKKGKVMEGANNHNKHKYQISAKLQWCGVLLVKVGL